jgi:hypothetical protein
LIRRKWGTILGVKHHNDFSVSPGMSELQTSSLAVDISAVFAMQLRLKVIAEFDIISN